MLPVDLALLEVGRQILISNRKLGTSVNKTHPASQVHARIPAT
jgi:hypothetical protein